MADTEQGGAPSASAGGAPAPGLWDIGHSPTTGGRNLYVRGDSPDSDVYVGVIFEPADAARIVELMNAKWRADFAVDAEIEELETQHARNIRELIAERDRLRRRREDEADERATLYGGLVNRIREALHEDAQVETANVGALSNEILRLVHAFEQREGYAAERDDYANRLRETDRAYMEVTAERDRLRQELNDEQQLRAEIAGERDRARVEQSRLRAELDLIGEQVPKFRDGQRVRIGRHFGTVEKPKAVTRVRLDGMAPAALFETRLVNAVEGKPAEPRRWVAGDAEPEIGTTVRRADGDLTNTRRKDGTWHVNTCPYPADECEHGTRTWEWLTKEPLVEAVDSDG